MCLREKDLLSRHVYHIQLAPDTNTSCHIDSTECCSVWRRNSKQAHTTGGSSDLEHIARLVAVRTAAIGNAVAEMRSKQHDATIPPPPRQQKHQSSSSTAFTAVLQCSSDSNSNSCRGGGGSGGSVVRSSPREERRKQRQQRPQKLQRRQIAATLVGWQSRRLPAVALAARFEPRLIVIPQKSFFLPRGPGGPSHELPTLWGWVGGG